MSFSDWKKTSKLYAEWQERGRREFMDFEIVTLCESAYKAGRRDGQKDGDKVIQSLLADMGDAKAQFNIAIAECEAIDKDITDFLDKEKK